MTIEATIIKTASEEVIAKRLPNKLSSNSSFGTRITPSAKVAVKKVPIMASGGKAVFFSINQVPKAATSKKTAAPRIGS